MKQKIFGKSEREKSEWQWEEIMWEKWDYEPATDPQGLHV